MIKKYKEFLTETQLSITTDIEPNHDELVIIKKWLIDNKIEYSDYEFDGRYLILYNSVIPGHLTGNCITDGDVIKFNRKDIGLVGKGNMKRTHKQLDSPIKTIIN
jgi:hypothetical protein